VLTLSQLTAGIARVFEESFQAPLWIKAEIAKLNHYPGSGHCYPSLVEKEKGTIKAEMRATIWANDFARINQNFMKVTREPLKEGIQILFRALVKFHAVYGLSLQVIDIDPSYTLGEMAREKMETIVKLKQEGLFDKNRGLELPLLPKRIAIISVKTSKGFSDFMSILENNPWGYAFSCFLFPALLQGDKAVESILGQLKVIKAYHHHFDAVVLIRGGGGDVGLNCYDNYQLAREVASFPLTVITGIGHSTNETVTEMVAGFNKITPTDVAYFLIQQFHNFAARVQDCRNKIMDFSVEILEEEKKNWEETGKQLFLQTDNMLKLERNKLQLAGSRLRYRPGLMLQEKRIGLLNSTNRLAMRVNQALDRQVQRVTFLGEKIQLLDPYHILKRGYTITYLDGKVLTDISGVEAGDELLTRFHNGVLKSVVKSKSE